MGWNVLFTYPVPYNHIQIVTIQRWEQGKQVRICATKGKFTKTLHVLVHNSTVPSPTEKRGWPIKSADKIPWNDRQILFYRSIVRYWSLNMDILWVVRWAVSLTHNAPAFDTFTHWVGTNDYAFLVICYRIYIWQPRPPRLIHSEYIGKIMLV